jgi:hypothetical protein
MNDLTSAPAGDSAPVADVAIPTHVAGGDGPLSLREAGRSVTDWRRKEAAQDSQVESAPEATPAQESGEEPDAAPQETEAPGETQEAAPAEVPPIEPPRSWTKEAKDRWQSLPRETQEYIAGREQEREREIRRSQNEAAEKLKGMSAREQQLEQARQQYEQALPALLQTLQQSQAGEFADVTTHADLERMAAEDPVRYLRWDAAQKKIAAVTQEARAAQERQAQENSGKFAEFAKRQDELFIEKAPEFADKEAAAKLQGAAIEVLRDLGFDDDELGKLWNGQAGVSLRDHRLQLLIRDGIKYREAKTAVSKVTAKPLPPVQRPGAAQPRGAAKEAEIQTLSKQLDNASGMNALRTAAALVAQRRATAR